MTVYLLILLAVLTAAAVIALHHIRRTDKLQTRMAARVRTTALYGHIYPLLLACDSPYLESLTVRPEGISLRLYEPLGSETKYTFKKHGLDEPTPETLEAVAHAIAIDLPILQDDRHYAFKPHTATDHRGQRYRWYAYTVKPEHKSRMLRLLAQKRAEEQAEDSRGLSGT